MTELDLKELINEIKEKKYESQTLELKADRNGYTKKLYDTLSSFSNQDDGGIIVFGIDEKNDYELCGVYDENDLQKQINNQCLQMEPVVRPVLTVLKIDGKAFVAAEIPSMDIVNRPCYYKGVGRIKGSYVRVGDSDEHMTEYEIYSFEAYRKKYQDDARIVERTDSTMMDETLVTSFLSRIKSNRPNLAAMSNDMLKSLYRLLEDNKMTVASLMVFCHFPQAFYPQLGINALVVPGTEIGDVSLAGERFIDNQRIEGNIADMLETAIAFVRRNTKTSTSIDSLTGERIDKTEYPMVAVREALLNALVHRDYSMHTEGMPIQLIIFDDRLEIRNPGGLYGRLSVDQLGKVQPDTRNPIIVTMLETLGITENRYSGIPTIKRLMKEYGLAEPVFENDRGSFVVKLYKEFHMDNTAMLLVGSGFVRDKKRKHVTQEELLEFLRTERTRQEIVDFLGKDTITYTMQQFVEPLIDKGLVKMTIPDKPKSRNQKYYSERR